MPDKIQARDSRSAPRRWYERPLWVLWFILEFFFLQGTIASYQELEPRAAILFAGIFVTLLLSAGTILIIRRNRLL